MTTVALCPTFGIGYQAFDASGLPLNAGLIYTYQAGTTTNQATYTTSAGSVTNTNPIVLGADGRPPAEIWLDETLSYRFDVKDSLGNTIGSYDNISIQINTPQIQQGGLNYLTSIGGTGNAVTAVATPAITDKVAGRRWFLIPGATNTGPLTLNIGAGALAVLYLGAACSGGEFTTSVPVELIEDGTQYNITSAASTASATRVVGEVIDYAGSSLPTGWLECDGSAVSRTTYASLFSAIGTTWGAGDGSTTFNLPPQSGRGRIGRGTGTVVEAVTASSANGFTVASNNTKWITGLPIVISNLTGFTTTATAGPTYYIYRVSGTNVQLGSTLALALAGTPDITISGTGTATLTATFTARTIGETGGEEGHSLTSGELGPHVHSVTDPTHSHSYTTGTTPIGGSAGSDLRNGWTTQTTGASATGISIQSTGSGTQHNTMLPFGVFMTIIKY